MARDAEKNLEQAKRHLEKGQLREALADCEAAAAESPCNAETLELLADVHGKLKQPEKAAHARGMQFDHLCDAGEFGPAGLIYGRFLKDLPQPPERILRYASILQRQGLGTEASTALLNAAEGFVVLGDPSRALECLHRVVRINPEEPKIHLRTAEVAQRLGDLRLAQRANLRAGQLHRSHGDAAASRIAFTTAHALDPSDRTASMFLAELLVEQGDAQKAAGLLDGFALNGRDTALLRTRADALRASGQRRKAREALEALFEQRPEEFPRLAQLAGEFLRAGEDADAIAALERAVTGLRGLRREKEFGSVLGKLTEEHAASTALAGFALRFYEETGDEAGQCETLSRLVDLHLEAGKTEEAVAALERLAEVDPADARCAKVLEATESAAGAERLKEFRAKLESAAAAKGTQRRMASARTANGRTAESPGEIVAAGGSRELLDDLLVQAELFLQYGLDVKAMEQLDRVAENFPEEITRNERVRRAAEQTGWAPRSESPDGERANAEFSGLAGGAKLSRALSRQASLREMLAVAAREVAERLGAQRSWIVWTRAGDATFIAEYSAAGFAPAAAVLDTREWMDAAGESGEPRLLTAEGLPTLRRMGISTALGVTMRESAQAETVGAMFVGSAGARFWQAHEHGFLRAVAEQSATCAAHSRLRLLAAPVFAADERTGALSRAAFRESLVAEARRTMASGLPAALLILQWDQGDEAQQSSGAAAMEREWEAPVRAVARSLRHGDIVVQYGPSAIAVVLPETGFAVAQELALRLRATALRAWPRTGDGSKSISIAVTEFPAGTRATAEDAANEWASRAEAGWKEIRRGGQSSLVCLPAKKI